MQIREVIYNQIISGEYKAGDKLPSEEKLAKQFGVSRMTVCKALEELVNNDYLMRKQGSGTYVSKIRKEGSKLDAIGFRDSMTKKGFRVSTNVLKKETETPSKEIASKLEIPLAQNVLHLVRLRKVNGEPIVVQDSYLNLQFCTKLTEIDFEKHALYESIRNICKNEICSAKDVVEAVAADREKCQLLEVKEGFPLLLIKRIAYTENKIPLEYTCSYYRSDQYILEVEYK